MIQRANSYGWSILALGDLIFYAFSLVATLAIRYDAIPSRSLVMSHVPSFIVLFIVFILVSLSAGLYDKQIANARRSIVGLILKVQLIDILLGTAFFYLAPAGITPKANLVIYFIISTLLILLWRIVMAPVLTAGRKQSVVLVGTGADIKALHEEVNAGQYAFFISDTVNPVATISETVAQISETVEKSKASIIVADLSNPHVEAAMPFLYSIIFSGIQVIDASKLYENVFDRIPLSMIGERWMVENSASVLASRHMYDALKRTMDILAGFILGTISLIFYPFVYIAIKIEDKGPLFITQERIGKKGKIFKILKFRSMSGNDQGKYGDNGSTSLVITRVGKFIRVSRIDELPQLWNLLKGDLSLIGPRPELPSLVSVYDREIPYYSARHLVTPGLSGWAQIYHEAHPHHSVATEETRDKLSYDLYYVKNASFMLDLKIALRTLQILLKRSGR